MSVRALVRRYQRYDPMTGQFNVVRSDNQYARLLGVRRALLSRFYSGQIRDSRVLVTAFLRTFPHAIDEFASAMLAEVA